MKVTKILSGMTWYEVDFRIYDKFGVIEELFNTMTRCFQFVTAFSNDESMYIDTNRWMKILRAQLTELETISPEKDLQDFARCSLQFLEAMDLLFLHPEVDSNFVSACKWYENVKYRRIKILVNKEAKPF